LRPIFGSAFGASRTSTHEKCNNSQFTVGGLTLPITIPAGQSTAFTVALNPLVLERPVVF